LSKEDNFELNWSKTEMRVGEIMVRGSVHGRQQGQKSLKRGGLLIDIDWVGRACGPGFESSGLVGGSVQAQAQRMELDLCPGQGKEKKRHESNTFLDLYSTVY